MMLLVFLLELMLVLVSRSVPIVDNMETVGHVSGHNPMLVSALPNFLGVTRCNLSAFVVSPLPLVEILGRLLLVLLIVVLLSIVLLLLRMLLVMMMLLREPMESRWHLLRMSCNGLDRSLVLFLALSPRRQLMILRRLLCLKLSTLSCLVCGVLRTLGLFELLVVPDVMLMMDFLRLLVLFGIFLRLLWLRRSLRDALNLGLRRRSLLGDLC